MKDLNFSEPPPSFLSTRTARGCYDIFFLFVCFFKILLICRVRGREGEREGEKHQCVVASCAPTTGGLACNPACAPTGNQTGNL